MSGRESRFKTVTHCPLLADIALGPRHVRFTPESRYGSAQS
jgi:hypothetical protein